MKQILYGHTNEDNAYVVPDYPYGYTLRTKIRYWVESNPRFGQRLVSQTMNPKTGTWNRPKASTYTSFVVMFVDDANGHVYWSGWHPYNGADELQDFIKTYGAGLDAEHLDYANKLLQRYEERKQA